MPEQTASPHANLTIQQQCAGDCGAPLTYAITEAGQPYAPELHCVDGRSQFRGGHLCKGCETVVGEALAYRRAMNAPGGPIQFERER